MRDPILAVKTALVAGAALALAACGGEPAVNNYAGNDLEANASFEELGNDASAMETASNTADTVAPADNAADNASGEDDGGDTGGNNVESNTVGM